MWANTRGISSAGCGSTKPPATAVTCNGQHLFRANFIQMDHFGNVGEKASLPVRFAFPLPRQGPPCCRPLLLGKDFKCLAEFLQMAFGLKSGAGKHHKKKLSEIS